MKNCTTYDESLRYSICLRYIHVLDGNEKIKNKPKAQRRFAERKGRDLSPLLVAWTAWWYMYYSMRRTMQQQDGKPVHNEYSTCSTTTQHQLHLLQQPPTQLRPRNRTVALLLIVLVVTGNIGQCSCATSIRQQDATTITAGSASWDETTRTYPGIDDDDQSDTVVGGRFVSLPNRKAVVSPRPAVMIHGAASNSPTARRQLLIGIAHHVRGGDASPRKRRRKPQNTNTNKRSVVVSTEKPGAGKLFAAPSPQTQSILWMTLAMACHYLGYGIARSITVSLFTSAATGYATHTATAVSLAMTLVSPVSIALLLAYTRVLNSYGPPTALRTSTLACAGLIGVLAIGLSASSSSPHVRYWTGPLFVVREAYVQLLTSQFWSFFASALTPRQAAQWFGPIASVTSCASAVAGWGVGPLVRWCRDHPWRRRSGGPTTTTDTSASSLIQALLLGNVGLLVLSALAAHCAYSTWAPPGSTTTTTKGRASSSSSQNNKTMFHKAMDLFRRVPVLKALLLEILTSQALSTLLNVCFVARVGTALPDDTARAAWLGRYYGGMNLLTLVLQGGILPLCFSRIEPKTVWRLLPLLPLVSTAWQVHDPSLRWVSLSLLVMKVTEYSARKLLDGTYMVLLVLLWMRGAPTGVYTSSFAGVLSLLLLLLLYRNDICPSRLRKSVLW